MYNTFSGLARDVFTLQFDSNTGVVNFSQISGWFATHLGDLNNLLNTSFEGVDPLIDQEAGSIYKKMYTQDFYSKQMRRALMGITSASSDGSNILSVSDGDNKIVFVNKNEVAKSFRSLANDLATEIDKDSHKYTMYLSQPQSVNDLEVEGSGYVYGGYNSYETVY